MPYTRLDAPQRPLGGLLGAFPAKTSLEPIRGVTAATPCLTGRTYEDCADVQKGADAPYGFREHDPVTLYAAAECDDELDLNAAPILNMLFGHALEQWVDAKLAATSTAVPAGATQIETASALVGAFINANPGAVPVLYCSAADAVLLSPAINYTPLTQIPTLAGVQIVACSGITAMTAAGPMIVTRSQVYELAGFQHTTNVHTKIWESRFIAVWPACETFRAA